MSRIFNIAHATTVDRHARRRLRVFSASCQLDLRDGRDRSKCFATKTERPDRGEIFRDANLRRRVTFESEHGIGAHHAFTIVGNLQQATAAGFDLDRDSSGAGVDRILNQLLGDRRRPLNNFTGGDLIGDVICEDADFRHYNFTIWCSLDPRLIALKIHSITYVPWRASSEVMLMWRSCRSLFG